MATARRRVAGGTQARLNGRAAPLTQAEARSIVAQRLRARISEMEQVAMTRLYAVAEPQRPPDPEYMDGLRAAVCSALDYLLTAIEVGEERIAPPPAVVLFQARAAARWGISLDTVLRRCFAGYTLFGDFLIQEAEAGSLLLGAALNRVLRNQAAVFDRLVDAVTEAYNREAGFCTASTAERHAKRIERLLVGELVDTNEIPYDFAGHHLGVIAKGLGALNAVRDVSSALDRQLLVVDRPDDDTVWAWFGGRQAMDDPGLSAIVSLGWPANVRLALGEPAEGISGWRSTHRQAKAVLPIVLRGPSAQARYSDVALLASVLRDDLLASSLRELYLAPLEMERDGGEALRKTLRAYFKADRNVSSAAAALGIKRHTVTSRLRTTEERIGRPLCACALEMDTALRLEALNTV